MQIAASPARSFDDDVHCLFAGLTTARVEIAAIAFFDPQRTFLGMRHMVGSPTRVTLPIRAIARDALMLDATAAILAHNHPSGDCRPSADDLAATRRLARALGAIGVTLTDHLVITGDRFTSLAALGFL